MRFTTVVLVAVLVVPVGAQEKIDAGINAKIRAGREAHSEIMRTLHMLTDVLRAACDRIRPV